MMTIDQNLTMETPSVHEEYKPVSPYCKPLSNTSLKAKKITLSQDQLIEESFSYCIRASKHIQKIRSTINRLRNHSKRINTYLNTTDINLPENHLI